MISKVQLRTPMRVLFALLALVVGIAWLPSPPALAEPGTAEYPAVYSACVGPAEQEAGFIDMEGSSARAAANCLVHYGITAGRTPELFSPDEQVSRWQMALFLARTAKPAGLQLPEAPEDQFGDLDGLSGETKTAINQIGASGIMEGTSSGQFSPNDLVTREHVILFLSRFLHQIEVGVGGIDINELPSDAYDEQFADIGGLSIISFRAVRNLSELGIVGGTSPTTFAPHRLVTRAQMAMFITRTLAHTNARPAGVTAQATAKQVNSGEEKQVVITVRDDQFQPIRGASVDIFLVRAGVDAFEEDGTCTAEFIQTVLANHRVCQIDSNDLFTDQRGNLVTPVSAQTNSTLYAWIGPAGGRFTLNGSAVLPLEVIQQTSAVVISDDLPAQAREIKFGSGATFTFQLVDEFGEPVAIANQPIAVQTRPEDGQGDTLTLLTNEAGTAFLTLSRIDPEPDQGGDSFSMQMIVSTTVGLAVQDKTTVGLDNPLRWSDELGQATSLVLNQERVYQTVSQIGKGVSSTITADLRDQYGDPVYGKRIEFWSDDQDGVSGDRDTVRYRRTTNRQGTATLTYLRDSLRTATEAISAQYVAHINYPHLDILADPINKYWVLQPLGNDDGTPQVYQNTRVLHHEPAIGGLVLFAEGAYFDAQYKVGDIFVVEGQQVSIGQFRRAIATGGNSVTATIYNPGSAASNIFIVASTG